MVSLECYNIQLKMLKLLKVLKIINVFDTDTIICITKKVFFSIAITYLSFSKVRNVSRL